MVYIQEHGFSRFFSVIDLKLFLRIYKCKKNNNLNLEIPNVLVLLKSPIFQQTVDFCFHLTVYQTCVNTKTPKSEI